MTKPAVGVIGYGDFAKLMIQYLAPYADIVVASRDKKRSAEPGFRFVDNEEALSQRVVIPAIPAQFLEDYFSKNTQYLKPGTLVVDVCSVKVKPVEVLSRLLPANVSFLATHPMFGPASAAESLKGRRIMLHPVRLDEGTYQTIKTFCTGILGLKVIEVTPEEHDRAMAYVQGLSHYIGRVMDIMKIPNTELLTEAYDDLLDMRRVQGADSWELFESIMFENPYARDIHHKFEQACRELDKKLGL